MKRIWAFLCSAVIVFASVTEADAADCVIKRVPNEEMKIALTFDDGPHYKYTAEILDILKAYDVTATFFVIGSNAAKQPSLIERELAEGHEVENHTFDHVYLRKLGEDDIRSQVIDSESIIAGIADYNTSLIRPPGGLYDDRLPDIASEIGYKIVLWSIDTCDWEHRSPQRIADNVLSNVKSGDIILMHDFIGKNSPTPAALEIILPELIKRGYKFVTVSELIELGDIDG